MSSTSLRPVLEKINFVNRYQSICSAYNDFDSSLRGNRKELYDKVLAKFKYRLKYFSKEHFYRIISQENGYEFGLQFTLKDGLVEPMIDVKKDSVYHSPDGRFDFIPEKMGVEFDRKKYNLPKYSSEADLEEILKVIFGIYEDIKREVLKSSSQA